MQMPNRFEEITMGTFLADYYLWTKSLHVISVLAWMAGLFYLPRLFVYHAEVVKTGTETDTLFQTMERRLLRAIMNPAMIATWIFGLALVFTPGIVDWSMLWPWTKAASVIAMTAFHMWLAARRKDFAAGTNSRAGRTYRMMNELPTLLMLVIVFSAVAKWNFWDF
ncbi:protoporphyrinogen oxidase HemJ [Cereibacter azotoformans]|nr:protoporphyrinogen oxidase HemJ [Cereibacter azotoformans]MBO4170181.1 protoporphyrinogen oxidase HemJ [Cereibacter azotoformans]UIJ30525.1 protoporphyrinogen oxidase HemJ [Cereibacter azotoformans]ULB11180.1 protoporphyrinogen oxidase HemJ [Cereibacter azotoformans]